MNRAPNVFEIHLLDLVARGGYDPSDPPIAEALAFARAHPEDASALLALASLHTALTGPVTVVHEPAVPPRSRPAPKARTGRPRPVRAPQPLPVGLTVSNSEDARARAARNEARNEARRKTRAQARTSADVGAVARAVADNAPRAAELEVAPAEDVQA